MRGERVANIVVSADATCRDESGDVVEPYWGSGVTSGFNRTKLDESGAFRSHQRYRHRNPVTHKVEPLYRDLRGSVEGPTGRAKVSIRYTIPLHRFRGQQVKCRTGRIAFDLSRLPRE